MSNPYVVKSLPVDAPTIFIQKLEVLIHDQIQYHKLQRQDQIAKYEQFEDHMKTQKKEMRDMLVNMFKVSSSDVFRLVEHMEQLIRIVILDQLNEKNKKYINLEADMQRIKKVLSFDLSTLVKIATNN
jgi:hypothetical protein